MRHETTVKLDRPLKGVSLLAPPPASSPASPVPRPAHTTVASSTPSPALVAERESIELILIRLQRAAEELRAQQREKFVEMQRGAVILAVAIASHLVHEHIRLDQHGVEALIQKTVAKLEPREPVTVWLHPDDLRLLQQRLGDRSLLAAHGAVLRLETDPALKRGDCRAAAETVSVQWLLADQFEEIRAHLLVEVG